MRPLDRRQTAGPWRAPTVVSTIEVRRPSPLSSHDRDDYVSHRAFLDIFSQGFDCDNESDQILCADHLVLCDAISARRAFQNALKDPISSWVRRLSHSHYLAEFQTLVTFRNVLRPMWQIGQVWLYPVRELRPVIANDIGQVLSSASGPSFSNTVLPETLTLRCGTHPTDGNCPVPHT